MKRLVFLFLLLFSFSAFGQYEGKTKHKTVNKMTTHQVRNAQKGKSYYTHHKGKVKKNNCVIRFKKRRK